MRPVHPARMEAELQNRLLQMLDTSAKSSATVRDNSATRAAPLVLPGQTAKAQVLQVSQESGGRQAHTVLLSLGEQKIAARSQVPLQVGQQLVVRQPEPGVLQIIPPNASNREQQLRTLAQALRNQLPQQQPLVRAMRHFTTLLQRNAEAPGAQQAAKMPLQTGKMDTSSSSIHQPVLRSGVKLRPLQSLQQTRPLTSIRQTASPSPSPAQSTANTPLTSATQKLPPAIRQTLQTLVQSALLRPRQLNASQLKNHISNSGLLLESKLQHTSPREALQQDMKANLLRLQQQVQQAQPQAARDSTNQMALKELLGQTQQALARVTTQQLNSLASTLQAHDSGNTTLLNTLSLELPVQFRDRLDALQLEIEEREGKGKEAQEKQWKITLSAELDILGTLYAQVLLGGGRLSTTLWVEQAQWLDTVRQALAPLEQRLQKLGVEVAPVCCYAGKPKLEQTRLEQQLVDTQA